MKEILEALPSGVEISRFGTWGRRSGSRGWIGGGGNRWGAGCGVSARGSNLDIGTGIGGLRRTSSAPEQLASFSLESAFIVLQFFTKRHSGEM